MMTLTESDESVMSCGCDVFSGSHVTKRRRESTRTSEIELLGTVFLFSSSSLNRTI